MRSVVFHITFVMALALAAPAAAQTALPLGKPQQGRVTSGAAEYTVAAKTAGVLVVALKGDSDLVVQVTDSDGQSLPNGRSDQDLNGSGGTEMVSVVVPEPGTYGVRVSVNGGGSASFEIGGAWMAFPAFEMASRDPDRRPSTAKATNVGAAVEDTLKGEDGDQWDWFALKPAQAGTLVVVIRRSAGDADLALEAFLDGNFSEPAERSDQDLQGNSGDESVMLKVTAGQTVHVKVFSLGSNPTAGYRLSSSILP